MVPNITLEAKIILLLTKNHRLNYSEPSVRSYHVLLIVIVFFQILESFHLVSHWLMEEWRQPKFLSMWVHTVDLYYHRKEILQPVYCMLPLAWIKHTLGWFNANSGHMGTVEPKSWNYCIMFLHFGNELNFLHAVYIRRTLCYTACLSSGRMKSAVIVWMISILA